MLNELYFLIHLHHGILAALPTAYKMASVEGRGNNKLLIMQQMVGIEWKQRNAVDVFLSLHWMISVGRARRSVEWQVVMSLRGGRH